MPAAAQPVLSDTRRRRMVGDLIDISVTILLAVFVALALRARATPLHLPAIWVLAPLLGSSLSKAPRVRRVWWILCIGAMAGMMVSGPWIR